MVKIFIGNLSDAANRDELYTLFEPFGEITECDVLNRFGFVVSIKYLAYLSYLIILDM